MLDAHFEKIADECVLAMLPKEHPANAQARQSEGEAFAHLDIRHLDGETFILPPENQSLRITAKQLFEEAGIRPGRILEIRSSETISGMIEQGMGVSLCREGYINTMNQYKNVRYYRIGDVPFSSELVLWCRNLPAESFPPQCEKRLAEIIIEETRRECTHERL